MSDTTPEPTDAVEDYAKAIELAKASAVDASTSTDIAVSTDTAVALKKRLGDAHSTVARAVKDIEAKRAVAQAAIDKQRADLEAMMRASAAEMAPLMELMKRAEEGMHAANLYLGRDEYIEEIRTGAPAPADTPLSVRQQVLAMDEEAATHAITGGLDAEKIDAFLEWMLESEANIDQVLPEKKGIVAIIPRRKMRDYGQGERYNIMMAEANAETWFILRNGDNLWLMTTDFLAGSRLLPDQGTFTRMFEVREHDGSVRSLVPGSSEWVEAEKRASAVNRHYMKVALILQGLVDRTAVFHPLPAAGLNLLTERDYINGNIVRIEDDFNAIGTGRPTFLEWQKQSIAKLDVGHRVIGHFPSFFGKDADVLIHPRGASGPTANIAHTITRKDADYLYFTYDRTDYIYRANSADGDAKSRATYKLPRNPWGTVSYVPVDDVAVDEMEYYLGSRSERHEYLNMFPALQAAIQFKTDEYVAEAPFRALLTAALAAENLVDEDNAEEATVELIVWWKTANKWHRALNGEPDHERRAQSGILREGRRRKATAGAASVADLIKAAVPTAMVVAARTSDLVAVEAQPRVYGAESVPQNLWVRIHEFTKKGKPRSVSEWKTLTRAQVAKWTVLHQTEAWDGWLFNAPAKSHLTDHAIADVIERILVSATDGFAAPFVVNYRESGEGKSPWAALHFESSFVGENLDQPYKNLRITVADGAGKFTPEWGGYTLKHSWRTSSGWNDPKPESPHEVNYWGGIKDATVFTDDAALAREVARGDEWYVQYTARRVRSSKIATLQSHAERAWNAAELEGRRLRFIEDFGDESLWADHQKTQRVAKYTPSKVFNDALGNLVDNDIDVAGVTFAEVAVLAGIEEELPADFRDLRFPEAKAE